MMMVVVDLVGVGTETRLVGIRMREREIILEDGCLMSLECRAVERINQYINQSLAD